jgi:predicted RNA-binding Zn-ribbon protein involved in translation (DUF1610 family)
VNLHDRLAAAKAERRRAAGLPPVADDDRTAPLPPAGAGGEGTSYDVDLSPVVDLRSPTEQAKVIEFRALVPAGESRPTPAGGADEHGPSFSAALEVSAETTCPRCGTEGRRNMEDVVGGVDHFSCPACGNLYQVARPTGA